MNKTKVLSVIALLTILGINSLPVNAATSTVVTKTITKFHRKAPCFSYGDIRRIH